jgi:hypothetical protein
LKTSRGSCLCYKASYLPAAEEESTTRSACEREFTTGYSRPFGQFDYLQVSHWF